jgi:hypothetical protein
LPATPKRRFLKLNVGEVSLVDIPANEVEFLVTKNLEEQVMGEQQETAERVVVEQPAGGESDVASVLKHVNAIVENIATVVKAQSGQASAPAIVAAAGGALETESDEEADVEKSLTEALKAMGIEPTAEQLAKAKKAGFDPAQKFPFAKKPRDKEKKTTKAAPKDEVEAFAETALTIEGLSSMITKAKKFTPGRIEKLKGAVDALKGLLEEIDSVPQGTNPGVSPGGSTSFGSSGVKDLTNGTNVDTSKSAEPSMADVLKAVNGLAESVKGLSGKVETIEKARPASASLEGQGGTESNVKKSSSIWGGIL